MRKIKLVGLISLIFIAIVGIFVACNKENNSIEVPNEQKMETYGSSSCSCSNVQTKCSSDGVFSGCCICCDVGSHCGSGTTFGFAYCDCTQSAPVLTTPKVFVMSWNNFLNYLNDLNIEHSIIEIAHNNMIQDLPIYSETDGTQYVNVSSEAYSNFLNIYINFIDSLDDDTRLNIELYINEIS